MVNLVGCPRYAVVQGRTTAQVPQIPRIAANFYAGCDALCDIWCHTACCANALKPHAQAKGFNVVADRCNSVVSMTAVCSNEQNGIVTHSIQWFKGSISSSMSIQDIAVIQCRQYSGLSNGVSVFKGEACSHYLLCVWNN